MGASSTKKAALATELAFGRYEHRAELGQGGAGRVVEVLDHGDGGALKALKIVGREQAERLLWELEVLAGASHPSLARVHELLRVDAPLGPPFRLPRGAFVLVEDRAPGAASDVVFAGLDAARRSDLAKVCIAQIAGALDTLHARGLAHGDVKPSNVVVDVSGSPRATLVDLGLAVPFGRSGTGGTLRFLAPEGLLGERSPATDLYALGGTLHEWLVGASSDATRSDLEGGAARAWSPLPASVEPVLADLVRTCLAERAGDRPRVMADVARALGAADVLALIGAPSPIERARRASVVPIVGRAREVERIARTLVLAFSSARPRAALITVRGPSGSGRTRVVLEAVRAAQTELARGASETPSLRTFAGAPVVPHARTILFAANDEEGALAAHRAARLSGAPIALVIEREEAAEGADLDVVLAPLGALTFGELASALLDRPEAALVESYRKATHGLPGVFVRALGERWMAGGDPRSGPSEAVRVAEGDLGAARDLALAAALSGGSIDAATARRVAGRAVHSVAETLLARGLAEHDAEGKLHLGDANADRLAASATEAERRRIASVLVDALGPGVERALARAALGVKEAVPDVLAATATLRDAGAPERAARVLALASRFVTSPALAPAEGDALIAAGQLDAAIRTLERAPGWSLGEALRRAGRWDEARTVLERLDAEGTDRALARASLVRISMAVGGDAPELDATSSEPFVHEARALLELSRGRPERALAIARAARESASSAPAFERARSAARLWAVEASSRTVMGDAEGAHEAFEHSAELAARAGERHATAAFLVNLGIGRLELGLIGPALEALTQGAERLVLLGRDRDAVRALYNVANAASLAGDRTHARHAAEGALREAQRVGDDEARTLAQIVLADVDVGEGRPRAAERRLTELSAQDGSALVYARLAAVRALVGDRALAHDAIDASVVTDETPTPIRIERALAATRVALAEGDTRSARGHVDDALGLLGTQGGFELRLRALAAAVDVAESTSDAARAEISLRAQRTLLDRALASLPPERHGAFRALHARALAARPVESTERGAAVPGLTSHARSLLEEVRTTAIAERLVASARTIAAAEHAFLVVREPTGALVVRAAHGEAGVLDLETARFSTSIVARCLDRRARIVSIDAGSDLGLEGGASIHALSVRSVAALPLTLGDRPAVLYVDDRLRPSAFGTTIVDALEELASFASVAFANAARARRERRANALAGRRERALRATLDEKTREAAMLAAERPRDVEIVAESASMRSVVALTARVALSHASVLITGESGSGKEVLARFLHRTSARASGPLVAESCAAIPATLFESTLFGHVRGAFSGAIARRRGLFELAEGGTLFLDEVGEIPLPMQAKLLRALSAREIRPMGSERARPIDVRIVAATHRDLRALVVSGAFREDLFYRLAVVEVALPPLREREGDLEPLVRRLVGSKVAIEPAVIAAFGTHRWPGNVRELENEIRRALALDPSKLRLENLSPALRGDIEALPDDLDVKRATDRLERRLVEKALTRAGHNVTQAARLLGLSRFGLQKMMARQRK